MTTRIPSQPTSSAASQTSRSTAAVSAPAVSVSKDSRFSNDFQKWLFEHGYGKYDFAKGNVPAFGGRSKPGEKVTKEPVIFIHGNSDSAAGWKDSIETFSKNGYKPSEMYAMTWGPSNPLLSGQQYHSEKYLEEVRAFIQAVKEYTGAEKVDVIGHSMGVTLARKAIQGGDGFDSQTHQKFNLGKPLTNSVDTFVGIAGANHGLASALWTGDLVPTTNTTDGLHPASKFLEDINAVNHDEGAHVYSIWSNADELIGVGLAGFTSPIPGQDGEKVYNTFPFGHIGLKDLTAETQLAMIRDHEVR
jgi:triacylglycerol lipase